MGWQRWLVSVPAGHRVGTELPRATGPPGAGSASAKASQVQPGSCLHPRPLPFAHGLRLLSPRVRPRSEAQGSPGDPAPWVAPRTSAPSSTPSSPHSFPRRLILRLLKCRVRFCVPGSTDGHRVTGCSVRSWWPRKHAQRLWTWAASSFTARAVPASGRRPGCQAFRHAVGRPPRDAHLSPDAWRAGAPGPGLPCPAVGSAHQQDAEVAASEGSDAAAGGTDPLRSAGNRAARRRGWALASGTGRPRRAPASPQPWPCRALGVPCFWDPGFAPRNTWRQLPTGAPVPPGPTSTHVASAGRGRQEGAPQTPTSRSL